MVSLTRRPHHLLPPLYGPDIPSSASIQFFPRGSSSMAFITFISLNYRLLRQVSNLSVNLMFVLISLPTLPFLCRLHWFGPSMADATQRHDIKSCLSTVRISYESWWFVDISRLNYSILLSHVSLSLAILTVNGRCYLNRHNISHASPW